MRLAFDIFPAADPKDGARLVRLMADDQLMLGSGIRVERFGLGTGVVIVNKHHPDVTAANFAPHNYCRVYDLDISSTIALFGFPFDERFFRVLSEDEGGGQVQRHGGLGVMSYFGRVLLDKINYVNFGQDAEFGPRADGYWWWYQDQYGDILKRLIDEAQDADRPGFATLIPDVTYDFDGTNDSAGDPWDTFAGSYSLPVGMNYLDVLQRLSDEGLYLRMDPEFLFQAFQADPATDRTSPVFADGKVRFVSYAEAGANANIIGELPRSSRPSIPATRALVKGDSSDPATMVHRTAAGTPAREILVVVDGTHAVDVLASAGDRALGLRADAADTPVFKHRPGANALAGLYSPFPPSDEIACFDLDPDTLNPGDAANGNAEDTGGGQWSGGAYQTTWRHAGARSYGVASSTTPDIVYTFESTQVFEAGQRYTLDVWNHQGGNHVSGTVSFGKAGVDEVVLDVDNVPILDDIGGYTEVGADGFNWAHRRVCWTPTADRTGVRFRWQEVQTTGTGLEFVLDDLGVWTAGSIGAHYWVGDLVTIATGAGVGDYDEVDQRVWAIRWVLDEAGNWWPVVELGPISDADGNLGGQLSGPGGPGGGALPPTSEPPPTLKQIMVNRSGGEVVHGDVVVMDPDNDRSFETTTLAAETRVAGVVQETIPNGASGYVATHGYVELVNVVASVTRNHYGFTSTTVKKASAEPDRAPGAFCQFLKGGTTPSAVLFGPPDSPVVATGLDDLDDVSLSGLEAGDRLRYDTSDGLWHNTRRVWMPLTTVVAGIPDLVWDDDDSLVPTEVPA